jgi:ABC-2 type transport system ATP-binding protein
MDDIEALCSRVILIHRGRILFDGALEGLRARVTNERELVVDLRDGAEGVTVTDPDAIAVRQDGPRARISYDPQRVATPDLIARITARYPVADLVVENPPIEEIVARLYKEMDA